MVAEIVAIGTELLMGQIANTDAQYLSRRLQALGISVYYHTTVGDNPQRLRDTLSLALSRSDVVVTTGGLGPTPDDLSKETAAALLPIGAFLILFQMVTRRLKRKEIVHMVIGLVYVYIGLTVFLMGVNVGFMPVGSFLGGSIASHEYNWILVPIAMVIGYFIVQAEPAVHVLNKQVEEITAGAIPAHAMNMALSVGVALSLGLAMIRVLTGISIMWFLIPGYAISLTLSFVVPHIFTSVAFDSGGVASGPMTATFLLPFALGACDAVGGNLVTDAFGVVAMVAMTPLVTIQLLGLSYQRKLRRTPAPAAPVAVEELIELC